MVPVISLLVRDRKRSRRSRTFTLDRNKEPLLLSSVARHISVGCWTFEGGSHLVMRVKTDEYLTAVVSEGKMPAAAEKRGPKGGRGTARQKRGACRCLSWAGKYSVVVES